MLQFGTQPRLVMLATLIVAMIVPTVRGDVVKLNNGGEVRGRIERSLRKSEPVNVETLTGGRIVIAAEEVELKVRRRPIVEEYETRARHTENTVAAQSELADWCKSKRLWDQRETHLLGVVDLQPDHEEARKALDHVLDRGRWRPRDDMMRDRGYVKYKNRYITLLEMELIAKSNDQRESEQAWHRKIHLWHSWLRGRTEDKRRDGITRLTRISDPDALPGLIKHFREDGNVDHRRMFVSILEKMKSGEVVQPLAWQALRDGDKTVRSASLEAIPERYSHRAASIFVSELRNPTNVIVRRAATALSEFGSEKTVPALIDALVTRHRYVLRVPDNSQSVTFNKDGSQGGNGSGLPPEIEAMWRAGQLPHGAVVLQPKRYPGPMKKVIQEYEHRNPEVLTALRKITGEDFGYNERTWRLWLASTQSQS